MPGAGQSKDVKLMLDEATLFYAMGNIEEALARFEAILEKAPSCKEARRMRARCRKALPISDKRHWEKTDLDWYDEGNALRVMGRHDEAIHCYTQVLALDNKFADAWGNMGVSFGQKGEHQKALECFDQALRIMPDDAQWLYNKGVVLRALGEMGKAFECFSKAEMLDPRFRNPMK